MGCQVCARTSERGISSGRISPTPRPQKPLIAIERSIFAGTQPPAIGMPFNGATMNQPTSAATTRAT